MIVRLFLLVTAGISAGKFQPEWQLNYLFPSMISEPVFALSPAFKQHIYSYSFTIPPPSKLFGPHVAFYLFAGETDSNTANIMLYQDGRYFQTLSGKQYWQSKKIPIPIAINQTTIELYIQDGEDSGPRYRINATRGFTVMGK